MAAHIESEIVVSHVSHDVTRLASSVSRSLNFADVLLHLIARNVS